MSKPHRYRRLKHENLTPTNPVPDVPIDRQARAMRELRALSNAVADSYESRDARMEALAASNSLSRPDMAVAAGMARSRVDQILRGRAEADAEQRSREGADRVARHSPS